MRMPAGRVRFRFSTAARSRRECRSTAGGTSTNIARPSMQACEMIFTKRLREGIRRRRITCSIRIWMRPHVKPGGCYRMDEGQIVVDSITSIRLEDITHDLARESGFSSVQDLLETAKHGPGENVYLIRFRY